MSFVACAAACHRPAGAPVSETAPPPAAVVPAKTEASAAPPATAPPPGTELPKELQASTPALAQMNLAMQEFVTQMGRPPTRLEELVEQRVLPRLPPPTPGKKFVLTKGKNNQPQVAEVPN